MKFSMKNSFSQCDQADLVSFTEEIVDGKLHFYAVLLFFQKSSFIDVWQCTAPHVSHCTSGVTVSIETGFSATKLFVYSDC